MIEVDINQKYRTEFMPHWGIADVAVSKEASDEIIRWLNERNIIHYNWPSLGSTVSRMPIIYFENEKDAIMFKMVWN